MSRFIATALFALSLLAAALAIPATADACSCAGPRDYRDVGPFWGKAIEYGDAAVIGVVKTSRVAGDGVHGNQIHEIRVRRNLKGPNLAPTGDTVEIVSPPNGGSCGLEAGVGDRIGLVLQKRQGRLQGLLCLQTKPAHLKRGAAWLESRSEDRDAPGGAEPDCPAKAA